MHKQGRAINQSSLGPEYKSPWNTKAASSMMDGLTASLSMRTGRGGSKVVASKRKPAAERRPRPQIDALYDELHQQYPQTFFRDPEKIHPLKIGIDHDLRERITAPKRVLHYCMKRYTSRPGLLAGADRPEAPS
jgi:hypothetical protein